MSPAPRKEETNQFFYASLTGVFSSFKTSGKIKGTCTCTLMKIIQYEYNTVVKEHDVDLRHIHKHDLQSSLLHTQCPVQNNHQTLKTHRNYNFPTLH